jgi:hypothetical protein
MEIMTDVFTRNKSSRFLSYIIYFLAAVIFFSCKTTPPVNFDAVISDTVPLDNGASVYVFADAKQSRSIIELLPFEEINARQTKQMLDRTDFIAAALFPKESGRRFQVVAWGNYPASMIKMAFSSNRNWTQRNMERGGTYWHSAADKLSIAMNSKNAFMVSSTANIPVEPIVTLPGVLIPEGFNEFREGSPFSFWLNNPAPMINSMLTSAGAPIQLPVQQLFVNLLPVKSNTPEAIQYEALIRFQFETAAQARGMASILYFSGFLPSRSNPASVLISRLFANVPRQNGRDLEIKTAYLSQEDIALLLQMFSLY